jgi:NADH-quinone oxidoreductase subunit L
VWFDNKAVDGFVNGIGAFTAGISSKLRKVQTGYVRSYALVMMVGVVVVLLVLAAVMLP